MQVTETSSDGLKRELKVTIPQGELSQRFSTRLDEVKDQVQLKGFRKGKVPTAHLKRLYGRSLMAGVGWQVTDRVTLDLGYRYLDMGKAESGHIDTAGFWNPKVRLDDLTAHELKFGLRFAFGGGTSCCAFMK